MELAFQRHQQGDLAGAETLYRQILRATPDQPDATRLLGEVLIDRGKTAEAIALLRRFIDIQPGHFISHYTLATAYRMAGQTGPAIAAYQESLARNPQFAGAHHGLGAALRTAEREAEAASSFRQAIKYKPDWGQAWQDLGLALAVLGDLPEAAAAFERAVALDPGLGAARRHLAALRHAPEQADLLQSRAKDAKTPVKEKIEILFTLGRLSDKMDQFDAAFSYFAQANALLRAVQAKSGLGYNRARMASDVDRLIATFTAEFFVARGAVGDASELPVFILGMPRAGSSLFEQIAASHSQVFGAGEGKGIGQIAARIGWGPSPAWTAESLSTAAAGYLQTMRAKSGAALRVIDKMPDNVFQLGLVATLFPNARVIFCARDPMDTCLSCFFQHFAEPYGFDTDLQDCAHRYQQIARLTAHWQRVLPLRMMTMSYESLLGDLQGEARRMIDFLGLEWEAECLNYYQATRPVRTASWSQVRQPLYQTAQGRWRAYAAHLQPLKAAFQA